MAGSFGSRIFIVAMATAVTVAAAACDVIVRSWRSTVSWIDAGLAWVVARVPKQRADWHRAWHRVSMVRGMNPITTREKRRPIVSPRFRMCPST